MKRLKNIAEHTFMPGACTAAPACTLAFVWDGACTAHVKLAVACPGLGEALCAHGEGRVLPAAVCSNYKARK